MHDGNGGGGGWGTGGRRRLRHAERLWKDLWIKFEILFRGRSLPADEARVRASRWAAVCRGIGSQVARKRLHSSMSEFSSSL